MSNLDNDSSRRSSKRGRYSFGSTGGSVRYRQKVKISQPGLGFEDVRQQPIARGSLHVDERFLPTGIPPGNILEIKGPANSGKTFLLTYLMARVLTVYPEKKIVFVDTRHKFSVKNFVGIISHTDKDLFNKFGGTNEKHKEKLAQPLTTLLEEYPEIQAYLVRIQVLQCYSAEDLMLTFGPPGRSVIQKILHRDENVCLVVVDSIDNFSHSETILKPWGQQIPNIMHNVRNAVSNTRCPVICTTLIPMDNAVYHVKRKPPSQPKTGSGEAANSPNQSTEMGKDDTDAPAPLASQQKKVEVENKCVNNFKIDYTMFDTILTLTPVSDAVKSKFSTNERKITHCVEAYLRSRHSAKPAAKAGSGGNQRVRFSIFSDMLWVYTNSSLS